MELGREIVTYLVKGDVAYSISLTTVSTLLAPVLTPTLTYLLAGHFMKVDFLGLFLSIIYTVVIPLIAGYSLRHFLKEKITPFLQVFPAISVAAIVIICAVVVALNQKFIGQAILVLFSLVVLLNAWGYFAGYFSGKLFRFNEKRKRTLSIEIGMQNMQG